MIIEEVREPTDPRLTDYRNLTDVSLRKRLEPEHGLFMAESHQVIERAHAAGYPVRSVLTTPRWLSVVDSLGLPDETQVFVGDEALVNRVTGYRVHRGALASMTRLPLPSLHEVLRNARRLLILRALWITRMSAPLSGALRRSASTGTCWTQPVQIRFTDVQSECRWVQCSRCHTRASSIGRTAWSHCRRMGSNLLHSRLTLRPNRFPILLPALRIVWR